MKILGIESTCDETAAAVVEFDTSKISRESSPKVEIAFKRGSFAD